MWLTGFLIAKLLKKLRIGLLFQLYLHDNLVKEPLSSNGDNTCHNIGLQFCSALYTPEQKQIDKAHTCLSLCLCLVCIFQFFVLISIFVM